jgi:hypothetical protein
MVAAVILLATFLSCKSTVQALDSQVGLAPQLAQSGATFVPIPDP